MKILVHNFFSKSFLNAQKHQKTVFLTFFVPDLKYLHGFWSKKLQEKHILISKIKKGLLTNFLLQKPCKYLKSGTKKVKNLT